MQPNRAHRYWHVIVCCGALVLVAGCGSPDSGSSSTPSPVSTSASTLADSTAPTQPAPGSATQATETPDLGDRCGTPLPASTPLWMGSGPDRLHGVAAGRGALGVVLIHGSGRRGLCTWAAESTGWPDEDRVRAAVDEAPTLVTYVSAPGEGHAQQLLYDVADGPSKVRSQVMGFVKTLRP